MCLSNLQILGFCSRVVCPSSPGNSARITLLFLFLYHGKFCPGEHKGRWVHGVRDRSAYCRKAGPRPNGGARGASNANRWPRPLMTSPPTTYEIIVTTAARMLRHGDLLLVGIGLPSGAANLARRTRCPNLVQIDECAVGAQPDCLPLLVEDPALAAGTTAGCSRPEVFRYYLHRGLIEVGFPCDAQAGCYGGLNTSVAELRVLGQELAAKAGAS